MEILFDGRPKMRSVNVENFNKNNLRLAQAVFSMGKNVL